MTGPLLSPIQPPAPGSPAAEPHPCPGKKREITFKSLVLSTQQYERVSRYSYGAQTAAALNRKAYIKRDTRFQYERLQFEVD